jgi:hypothetical protein
MLRRIASYKLIDVSDVFTASIIRAMLAWFRLRNPMLASHTGILRQLARLPEVQVHLTVILMRKTVCWLFKNWLSFKNDSLRLRNINGSSQDVLCILFTTSNKENELFNNSLANRLRSLFVFGCDSSAGRGGKCVPDFEGIFVALSLVFVICGLFNDAVSSTAYSVE